MSKKFKKFKISFTGMGMLGLVDFVLFVLYIICLVYMQDQSAANYVFVNLVSNILLVGISIATTTLITAPLIEVRNKNALYGEIIQSDVLSAPEFYETLSKEDREKMLKGLEANLYFDKSEAKEDMYRSIRKKLASDEGQIYLESCTYRIKCEVHDGCFEKTVLKTTDVRAYKPTIKNEHALCVTSAPVVDGRSSTSEIISLRINGRDVDIKGEIKTVVRPIRNDAFEQKNGYTQESAHYYSGKLNLKPDRATKIELSYKTVVPLSDIFYSCRSPYPCHKFSFSYSMGGREAENYALAVCAFGFADDAKKSPNHCDGTPEIEVNFDNWIFPLDGVAVTMKRRTP